MREEGWFLYRDLPFVIAVYDLYRYRASIASDSYLRSRADAQKRTIDVDYGHPGITMCCVYERNILIAARRIAMIRSRIVSRVLPE